MSGVLPFLFLRVYGFGSVRASGLYSSPFCPLATDKPSTFRSGFFQVQPYSSQLSGAKGLTSCHYGRAPLGQPDFLAPLRVVAQYRATTEAGLGRLSLGAFSLREMLCWLLVISPQRTIMQLIQTLITSAFPSLVVNSLLLIPRFWIARQMNSNQTIFLVLLRIRLAFRLRPSCAVLWGTCIALTKKLESSEADSQSGGRSSARSDLLIN